MSVDDLVEFRSELEQMRDSNAWEDFNPVVLLALVDAVEAAQKLRSENEIRVEIDRIEAKQTGSYEEMAGAVSALKWVLGDGETVEV